MTWAAIAVGVGSAGAGLIAANNKKTVDQKPQLTSQQEEAMNMLLKFSKTGQYGNYTAGESYKGDIGNYDKSALESASQNKLSSLMSGGMPEMFGMGANELKALLSKDSIYDPTKSGIYDSFKKEVRKNQAESGAALDKTMASTGNFYSGARNLEQRKLSETSNDQLTSKLASLYDTFAQRRLNAIPTAMNAGLAEENMNMGRISAGMQYGGLDRTLQTQQLTDKYNEWKRQREDMLTPLKSASTLSGQNVNWGTNSMTAESANPWQKVFDTALTQMGKNINFGGGKSGGGGSYDGSPFTYNPKLDLF